MVHALMLLTDSYTNFGLGEHCTSW